MLDTDLQTSLLCSALTLGVPSGKPSQGDCPGGGMAVGGPAHSLQFLLLAIHCTISLTGLRALTSPTHRKGSHSPQGGEIQAAFPSTRTSMRGK
jgi:hypothetical protein